MKFKSFLYVYNILHFCIILLLNKLYSYIYPPISAHLVREHNSHRGHTLAPLMPIGFRSWSDRTQSLTGLAGLRSKFDLILTASVAIIDDRNLATIWLELDHDPTVPIPIRFKSWIIISIVIDAEKIDRRSFADRRGAHRMALRIKLYIYTKVIS